MICKGCRREFVPTHGRQVYCTAECQHSNQNRLCALRKSRKGRRLLLLKERHRLIKEARNGGVA